MRGSRRHVDRMVVGAVAIAGATVIGIGALVGGGGSPPEGDRADAATAGAASDVDAAMASDRTPAQADDGVEGVEVHGSWTLEVRDPDGTLVDRRAFHNDLVGGDSGGGGLLARLLAEEGERVVARGVSIQAGTALCEGSGGTPTGVCESWSPEVSRDGDVLRLSHAFVVDYSAEVTTVETLFETQNVATPDDPPTRYPFTQRRLDTPQPVEAGQQVLVTVDISFS